MTSDELRLKFASLVRPCLGDEGEAKLFDVAATLEARVAADVFAATMLQKPIGARVTG